MFLRFAIKKRDPDSGRGLGIFHAAKDLCEHGDLAPWQVDEILDIRDWINDHLEKPDRFTASKPPYYRKQSKAISWFKPTATEHIAQVRKLADLLQGYGIIVLTYEAERVGYITYEDEFQIVAEPFADTIC